MPNESHIQDSGSAAELEFESSKIQEKDPAVKNLLRVVFVVGVGVLLVSPRYPYPLLSGPMTMLGFLAICLCTGFVLMGVPRDSAVVPKDILLALVPLLLAGAVFANEVFDLSPEVLHQTVVSKTSYGRRGATLVVQSWRPGHSTESFYVNRSSGFFYPGHTVTVGTRSGALGIPWITRITK